MAIGAQQAAIRAVIAGALAEHVSEIGQSVDARVAIRQAEAIVKALERGGTRSSRQRESRLCPILVSTTRSRPWT